MGNTFCLLLMSFTALSLVSGVAQGSVALGNPQKVTVCDLVKDPLSYSGHLVQVSGEIDLEFENFTIDDANCGIDFSSTGSHFSPVWLTFGGDASSPAVYCCGSDNQKRTSILEIEGKKLSLVHDTSYQELRDRLEARRLGRPDGTACYDECNLYRVSASITGTFFSKKEDSQSFSGYGHLGCCHLLAIQQVSEVRAERTDVPIGEFQCTSEAWTPHSTELEDLKIMHECPGGNNCRAYTDAALAEVASHWKDDVDIKKTGRLDRFNQDGAVVTEWISSDLLFKYRAHSQATGGDDLSPASVTRTRCEAKSQDQDWKQPGRPISCYQRELSPLQNETLARKWHGWMAKSEFATATKNFYAVAGQMFADGDQSWRLLAPNEAADHLLRVQTKRWKIQPEANLQFGPCADRSYNMSETGQIMDCSWGTRDGLQRFEVTLLKYNGADIALDDRSVPWVVSQISADVCEVH